MADDSEDPFQVVEEQKENIQHISGGRSVNKLKTVLSANATALQSELDKGHQLFTDQIEALECYENGDADADELIRSRNITKNALDDPLDIYIRYVKWLTEACPTGTGVSSSSTGISLLPLLENATRRFVGDLRYTQDRRYLKLWTSYAKQLDTEFRIDVWRFLIINDIGTSHATLYEELALDLELEGRRKEAEFIYSLGMSRRASPLAQLQKRHSEYQARMLVTPAVPSTSRSGLSGKVLGGGRAQIASMNSTARLKNNGEQAFTIYQDENGHETQNMGKWTQLEGKKERRKENDVESRPLVTGEKMPMSPGCVLGPNKIEVFRDEDDLGVGTSHPICVSIPKSSSRREKTETDLLRLNPFKNYPSTPRFYTIPVDGGGQVDRGQSSIAISQQVPLSLKGSVQRLEANRVPTERLKATKAATPIVFDARLHNDLSLEEILFSVRQF